MKGMFCECKIPEGFTLGEKFSTGNVMCMNNMFAFCSLPEGFSLGKHFDTSNVTDMMCMFEECTYGDYYVYDHFTDESDDEIIEKLRKH